MAKLYSVRIDEVALAQGRFERIGKKQPLRSLAEVRDFLGEYAQAWQQLPPPPAEEIEAQFEAQRADIAAEGGPPLPGSRECRFTLHPYGPAAEPGDTIEHVITILELTGTLSAQGEEVLLAKQVPVSVIKLRQCRVCGCTPADCQPCISATGAPCHWVGPDVCSACVAQATPLREQQWALGFGQAQVIERAIAAHNAVDWRRHDERLQLRVVHRNERDLFVYFLVARGEGVTDEELFELGWQARKLVEQEGGQPNG